MESSALMGPPRPNAGRGCARRGPRSIIVWRNVHHRRRKRDLALFIQDWPQSTRMIRSVTSICHDGRHGHGRWCVVAPQNQHSARRGQADWW